MSERTTLITRHRIGVDSGTVWIGDPCYLRGKINTQRNWEWAVDKRHRGPDGQHDPNPQVTEFHNGLWIGTLYGDGEYEVTIERNEHGQPIRFTVDFTQSYLDAVEDR